MQMKALVTVDWYDKDRTIVVANAERRRSWEDWFRGRDQLVQLLNSVDHRVDMLLMMRSNCALFLPDLADKLIELTATLPRNLHTTVITKNQIAWEMYQEFCDYFKFSYVDCMFAETQEDALKLIHMRRRNDGDNPERPYPYLLD